MRKRSTFVVALAAALIAAALAVTADSARATARRRIALDPTGDDTDVYAFTATTHPAR